MAEKAPVDGQSTVMGISLLILILAALPTLVAQAFAPATFGLFLAGVAVAVLFGVLNNQGYGWKDLGTVQIMTLILFVFPVVTAQSLGVVAATANLATGFLALTVLFSLYAVWQMFTEDNRLPHLAFLFIALLVGAGSGLAGPAPGAPNAVIDVVGMAMVIVAALVTVFAWPVIEDRTSTQI